MSISTVIVLKRRLKARLIFALTSLNSGKLNAGWHLLRIDRVDESNFMNIPNPCRCCLYWQSSDPFDEKMLRPENEQRKLEWLRKITLGFGNCMKIAYLNDAPIGFVQYSPAKFLPRLKDYASIQLSGNAIFIACLYITDKEARRKGFGTTGLKDLIAELRNRHYKAVETIARKSSPNNPSGPVGLYFRQKFRIKNEDEDFSLVHLEL